MTAKTWHLYPKSVSRESSSKWNCSVNMMRVNRFRHHCFSMLCIIHKYRKNKFEDNEWITTVFFNVCQIMSMVSVIDI